MFVLGLTHQQLFDWNDIFINASERSQIYYFTKQKNMVHYNFFIQVSDYILDLLAEQINFFSWLNVILN